MITIYSEDIDEVRDKRCCGEAVWGLEDSVEEWIKKDMGGCDGKRL